MVNDNKYFETPMRIDEADILEPYRSVRHVKGIIRFLIPFETRRNGCIRVKSVIVNEDKTYGKHLAVTHLFYAPDCKVIPVDTKNDDEWLLVKSLEPKYIELNKQLARDKAKKETKQHKRAKKKKKTKPKSKNK